MGKVPRVCSKCVNHTGFSVLYDLPDVIIESVHCPVCTIMQQLASQQALIEKLVEACKSTVGIIGIDSITIAVDKAKSALAAAKDK